MIAYFLYKTKFGNIVAAVNQVAGEMVYFSEAARGGFDGEGEEEQEYAEEEVGEAVPAPEMPPPAQ